MLSTIATTGFNIDVCAQISIITSAGKQLYLCISTTFPYQIDDNRVVGKVSIVCVSRTMRNSIKY